MTFERVQRFSSSNLVQNQSKSPFLQRYRGWKPVEHESDTEEVSNTEADKPRRNVNLLELMIQRLESKQQQESEESQKSETDVKKKCATCNGDSDVQQKSPGQNSEGEIQKTAAQGFMGSPIQLPRLDRIQQSFDVDLSHVQAYVGGNATNWSLD
jgi:hypothetical protein